MMYSEDIGIFPVTSQLNQICATLKSSKNRAVVLTAETGAGKSTILPLGLLEGFEGKILMTEPRRLAVLGVCSRVSELLNEEPGNTCGYKIHLEKKISGKTRLEVVTEAVLVRLLQEDPLLEDYKVVVLDEFHERSINLDLALAFLREAIELRDDLFVVVMSATINAEKIAAFLGTEDESAEIIEIPGRTFPVKIEYAGNKNVIQVVKDEVEKRKKSKDESGSILVFLPGFYEIKNCVEELKNFYSNEACVEICMLHSSVTLEEQRKVLKCAESGIIRVIVSSAIAETSITIPDVTVVIDSGLSRVNSLDLSSGMQKLETLVESEFSAIQRSGRAGRVKEGRCVRLWNQSERRIQEFPPEIHRVDLSSLVLECAERGVFEIEKINFLDAPKKSGWNSSVFLLKNIGLIDSKGLITEKGRAALKLPLNVRLASLCLSVSPEQFEESGAAKLVLKYSDYADKGFELQKKFLKDLKERLNKTGYASENEDRSILLLSGYADRLARRIGEVFQDQCEYQFPSGKKAKLMKGITRTPEWICAPEVSSNDRGVTIIEFEEICGTAFEEWLKNHTEQKDECRFDGEKIIKSENLCFGEIVLSSKKMPASASDYKNALLNEIKQKGFEVLPTDEKIRNLLLRAEFVREKQGKTLELLEMLSSNAEEWLMPFVTGKINEKIIYDGLYWYLNGAEIDQLAPEMLVLSNGRKLKVKYEKTGKIRPVIEVIIQRIFGCFETPRIMGEPVLLKLLSPASRPLQITEDLSGFWQNTWPEICKEMKGRYPKHNWDYRVAEE